MAFALAYLKALQHGSLPVSYAGFMMVGYGGIGKSSLLCGLKNQPLPDVPSSTLMADCHTISRPSQSSWSSSKTGKTFWKDVTEKEEYIEMARLITQAKKSSKYSKSLFDWLDQESPLFQHPDVKQIVNKVIFYATFPFYELEHEHWIRVWDCGGQKPFYQPSLLQKLCFSSCLMQGMTCTKNVQVSTIIQEADQAYQMKISQFWSSY